MIKSFLKHLQLATMLMTLALIVVQASTPIALAQVPEQKVLVVIVGDGDGGYFADGENIKNALLALGVDASSVRASPRGDVAVALAASVYDQIWVYDLAQGLNTYEADWQAIAAWFNEAPDRPIICDGRIISSYWRGRWQNEGKMLAENYYENLKVRGGGLVLGTDHNAFIQGINRINELIGLNPFFGVFNLTKIPVDTQNPLMTTPNEIGELWDDSSPSQTPYGLQPNGRILYTIAWHSNNQDTPGISSTIEGVIGLHVNITTPLDNSSYCNESGTITFQAEVTGGNGPYDYTWVSDINGDLGNGASLDVVTNALSNGIHTINVVATDSMDRIDEDQIVINIICSPNLIEFSSFSATRNGNNKVEIELVTGSETNTAALQVYRAPAILRNLHQIQKVCQWSGIGTNSGSVYSCKDKKVPTSVVYWPVEIENDGTTNNYLEFMTTVQ